MNFYEQIFSRGRATGEGMTHFERLFAAKFGGSPPPEVREYTGAVPVTITADGTPLLDYLITGNTVQSGTPTPDSPIMPEGTGERTENLANMYGIDTTWLNLTFKTDSNMTVKINGTKQDGANIRDLVHPNIVLPAGKYTIKIKMIGGSITNITGGVMFGINKSAYGMRTAPQVNTVGQVGTRTFTLNSDTLLTSLDITPSYGDTGAVFNDAVFQCWLYSGDGDVPYEPYGYKIPISSANTTTPVYLGEVQSTRRIKKYVITGQENTWIATAASPSGRNRFYLPLESALSSDTSTPLSICSHLPLLPTGGTYTTDNGYTIANSNVYIRLTSDYNSLADFKTYLQQQYTAGTPVTVWYVLATEETAVVNEPLMRIGDYADTLSKSQAGVSIPTNNGSTTVDVDTTVKPSEIYIKYMG